MILEIGLAFVDGVVFLLPFWYMNRKRQSHFRITVLLAIYTELNVYISQLCLSSEIVREALLIAISCCLVWLYIESFNLMDTTIFISTLALSDIAILFGYFISKIVGPKILDIKVLSVIVQSIKLVIVYSFSKYLLKRIDRFSEARLKDYAVLLIPMVALFEIIYQRFYISSDPYMIWELLAATAALIAAGYLLDKIYIEKAELEQEKMLNEAIALSAEQIQTNDKKQEEVRKIRHDITARLLTIQSLYNTGNAEAANTCIADILGELKNSATIKYCSDENINNLINYKTAINPEIHFDVVVSIDKPMDIDPMDVSVILANLIDNASRELKEHPSLNPMLILRIIYKREKLMISAENESFTKKTLLTDKEDKTNHGLGLRIVESIIKKYDGNMDITQNERFIVKVLLFSR